MNIHIAPYFTDNYSFILQPKSESLNCWLIDPGEFEPVHHKVCELGLKPQGIILTHHHLDHIRDVPLWLKQYPEIFSYGPSDLPQLERSRTIIPNQSDTYPDIGFPLTVIETPGHTLDHLCFYWEHTQDCFVGDTIFGAGCGRMFEGNPDQYWDSILKIRELPRTTKLWFGHEYTKSNLEFALSLWPEHQKLQQRYETLEPCTVPSTVSLEQQTNPFLWCDQDPLVLKPQGNTPAERFGWLRRKKG